MAVEPLLAVIDLGSNSFRLELARWSRDKFKRVAYHKETVRLGGGLDAEKNLTPAALQAGLACLRRFASVLAQSQPAQIRAIATQTLREAKNAAIFQQAAEEILGCSIDIISGREEARLIYQGVTSRLPAQEEKRLVIDIGGRSSEIILGQGCVAHVAESFPVGSVSCSQLYFADGALTPPAFAAAEQGVCAVLGNLRTVYPRAEWSVAYGSAGTTSAVSSVLQAAGFPADRIDREGLDWLMGKLCEAGHHNHLTMLGLKEDRRPVIGGGLATLRALFTALDIGELQIVSGALRHGVLQDLWKSLPKERGLPAVATRTA